MNRVFPVCVISVLFFPLMVFGKCNHLLPEVTKQLSGKKFQYLFKNKGRVTPLVKFYGKSNPVFLGLYSKNKHHKELFFKTDTKLFKISVNKNKVLTKEVKLSKEINISNLKIVTELFNSEDGCTENFTVSQGNNSYLIFTDSKNAYQLEGNVLNKFKNKIDGNLKNFVIYRLQTLNPNKALPVFRITDDLKEIKILRSKLVEPGTQSTITAIRTNFYKDSKYIYYGRLRLDSIPHTFKPYDIPRKDINEIQVLLRKNNIKLLDNLNETAVPDDSGSIDLIP